jgi:hypothetical protein
LWARHYRKATERRRARGWHRRVDGARERFDRKKVYVIAAAIFVALTIVALLIPR